MSGGGELLLSQHPPSVGSSVAAAAEPADEGGPWDELPPPPAPPTPPPPRFPAYPCERRVLSVTAPAVRRLSSDLLLSCERKGHSAAAPARSSSSPVCQSLLRTGGHVTIAHTPRTGTPRAVTPRAVRSGVVSTPQVATPRTAATATTLCAQLIEEVPDAAVVAGADLAGHSAASARRHCTSWSTERQMTSVPSGTRLRSTESRLPTAAAASCSAMAVAAAAQQSPESLHGTPLVPSSWPPASWATESRAPRPLLGTSGGATGAGGLCHSELSSVIRRSPSPLTHPNT